MRTRVTALLAAAAVTAGLALAVPATAAPRPVATLDTVALETAAAAAKVPKRNDGLNEPIYWVHGIQIGDKTPSSDCKSTWDAAIKRYRGGNYTGAVRSVAYYKADKNCNTRIASGSQNTSIEELGRLLAWDIYNRYTKHGKSVDAVGHSMGGLIIRAAITGVQKKLKGWPSKLYIEDVVTFSTPHSGTLLANGCGFTECQEMRINSSFLKWLSKTPYTAQRTDWTLIGSKFDLVVPAWSATVTDATKAGYFTPGHRVVFTGGTGLGHSTIYKQTANSGYKLKYWNSLESSKGWRTRTNTVGPVVMGRNGNYFAFKW
jgi:hypothetical protein